jgi:hypothetical protein
MKKLFRFVTNHPRAVIIAIFVPTLFFALQIPRLKASVNMKDWVPDNHPVAAFNQEMENQFGVVDPVIVGVLNDVPGGILRGIGSGNLHGGCAKNTRRDRSITTRCI